MVMSTYIPKGPRKPEVDCANRPPVKGPCKVCGLIRIYLMFAIPLIFLAFAGVEIDWPDINMTAVVGYAFLAAFLVQVAWRVYVDYFKKKP
jgi:hypothetical protein